MFRSPCAHRQEGKTLLHSLWYHHTEKSERSKTTSDSTNINMNRHSTFPISLTYWRRKYFFNLSTPCIQNVNNTGTKQVSIMKQTAF